MQWSLSANRCRFPHPLSMRGHLYLASLSKRNANPCKAIQINTASHIYPDKCIYVFIHSRVHSRVQNNLLTDFCSWWRQISRTWWRRRSETQIWSPVKTFILWSSSLLSKNWVPHRITRRPTCRTHTIYSVTGRFLWKYGNIGSNETSVPVQKQIHSSRSQKPKMNCCTLDIWPKLSW